MISDSIKQFLQDLDAKLPNEFSSDIDDALGLLADATSEVLAVVASSEQAAPAQNVEYSRVDPSQKISASDSPDNTDCIDNFPIHKPEGAF